MDCTVVAQNITNQGVLKDQAICDLNEHGFRCIWKVIDSFLNQEKEEEVTEAITFDKNVACIAGIKFQKDDMTEVEDDNGP